MAYDFFPKSVDEIQNRLKNWSETQREEVIRLYNELKSSMSEPINIDVAKKTLVNVSRQLQGNYTLPQITGKARLHAIKIKFGNGSSGNRGANNRGNLFETQFAEALLQWWEGEQVSDKVILDAIEDLDKTYKIRKNKTFKVEVVGGENTRRPLVFGSDIVLSNPKGQGNDVGKSLTDITLTLDGNKQIYLSLKLGSTTTFFNVGVKTILPDADIKGYNLKSKNGKALLKLFGIKEDLFCDVFNGKLRQKVIETPRVDTNKITKLLASGIGHNYHVIHRFPSKILSKNMDKSAMLKAASVKGSVKVYYGGKTGTGKRVNVEFQSGTYTFSINIRDTQGGNGYPTRMMCDFKYA